MIDYFFSLNEVLTVKDNLNNIYRVRQVGFTLMELLIVFVILGLLAGLVGPALLGRGESAKVDTAKQQISMLSQTVKQYYVDNRGYPSTQEGLKALIEKPANAKNWRGPYLDPAKIPLDPWDKDYMYRAPGENGRPYEISSHGADGVAGGEGNNADIKSE